MDLDFMEEIITQFRRDNNMEREMMVKKETETENGKEGKKEEEKEEPYSWLREYCPVVKEINRVE